jgi:hypothetical protein
MACGFLKQNMWIQPRIYQSSICAVVGLYVVLSAVGLSCSHVQGMADHTDGHQSHSTNHLPICAWACQVSSTDGNMVQSVAVHSVGLLSWVDLLSIHPPAVFLAHASSSRAPPHSRRWTA